jgi:hypothetical protein
MKTILATAAILAALAAPSFAETTGTDTLGSDKGSFRLSQKDPLTVERHQAMAQAVKIEGRKMSARGRS